MRLDLENQQCSENVDMEILYTEQLNHMIERDKLQLRCMIQPIAEKKDDIKNLMNAIASIKELKANMLKEIS